MASATHRGWLLSHNNGILGAVYNGALPGTTALSANTALGGVLVGTPVVPALAVDSLVISNTVASGDILLAANNGGNSQAWLVVDASAGTMTLYGAGVAQTVVTSTGFAFQDDMLLSVGTGGTARFSWDTTDANSNQMLLQLPAAGSVDSPVLIIGQSIESVDFGAAATGADYSAVVNPTVAIFSSGAVTTGPVFEFRKARGTTAAPTVCTSGDDIGQFRFYGAVANGEYVQSASIEADIAGTIATGRGPGTLTFKTATDAASSVLTTALTISAAQLVTCAAGVTLTTGNVTISSGNLDVSAGASDILVKAATAAALEISDATTKFYAVDTRVAVAGVTTHTFDISDYTVASAANAVATGLSVVAHTFNLTGTTQVTSVANTVSIGARTIAGDTATITVDQANTLTLVAPVEGTNVTLTAASALRITDAAGTPTNQYGIYIESLAGGTTANRGIYLAGANSVEFGVADDIIFPAATAAALELSDGTTKFLAFDTRVTTTGVTSIAFDISDYTFASAAGAVATGLSLAAHTLNLTGNTQVTTQIDTVSVGARSIAADGVGGACTVDEANSLLLVAPTEGSNVTLTAASALRILDAGGTPTNQYAIYIEAQSGGTTQNYAIYSAGGRNELINSFTGDGRVLKLSSTMTDGNNTDGYGVFEVDVTAAGTVAGTIAASSTWLNFPAAAVPGSNLICAQNNGIWLASGLTATNASMVIGMRMQYVPNDGADCSNIFCFDTNIYSNVLKSIFRVNTIVDMGGSTGAQTGNDYKVPLFYDVTANQLWYVNVYHT